LPNPQHEGDEKYILVHLTPLKPQLAEQFVVVSMALAYHSDIAFEYQMTLARGSYNMVVEGGNVHIILRNCLSPIWCEL